MLRGSLRVFRLFARILLCAWVLTAMSGCVFLAPNFNPFRQGPDELEEHVVAGEGKNKIVMLDISRTITNEEERAAFGLRRRESTVARIEQELRQVEKDDRVKAVVLRINSPGGTVTASDTIYHRLMRFKTERKIPVLAHFMDTATSGAYYVALTADEIIASPTSVTGSIGVVLYSVNLEGLLTKVGVSNQTIKSGSHKDIGSPLRRMTAEESTILQKVLDEMHSHFVSLVRERRPGFAEHAGQAAIDGRILTAAQARDANLIDGIGYLDDVLAAARRRAQISKASVVIYRRPEEFAENIYSRPALVGDIQVNLLNVDLAGILPGSSRFMYIWLPGAE